MTQKPEDYYRYCPGEEHILISDAVCLGRRRANFPKCPGCQFNDDEKAAARASDVAAAGVKLPQTGGGLMSDLDAVFKAYDVRGIVPEPLSEDVAWRIGNATAQFLRTSLGGYDRSDPEMNRLIVGRDMRKSSPMLSRAFIEGAAASGTHVIDIGLIDTPQIYFATNHLKCCGGAQTTASHNPENYNGFKICGPKGKPVGQDSGLEEIKRIAKALSRYAADPGDRVRTMDLSQPYRDYLRKFLKTPRPLKVVVDASNGMAGRMFPIVFEGVENLTVVELNFEHDGTFVHPPNPLVPANLQQLRDAVLAHGADFGACFDGDADRCMFVDEHSRIVGCDRITALLAEEFLREHPGSAIVYDLRSSRIVPETITAAGGRPVRQRVGHVFMKRAMAESGAVFGGELSGHFYFRDFFNCDCGLLAFIHVVNLLTARGKPLGELVEPLNKYVASGERNFRNDDKQGTIQRLAEKYRDAEVDFLDGITVQYPDWWFNVRPSNTEPLLRLNMEAVNEALLEQKLAELVPLLGEPEEGE